MLIQGSANVLYDRGNPLNLPVRSHTTLVRF